MSSSMSTRKPRRISVFKTFYPIIVALHTAVGNDTGFVFHDMDDPDPVGGLCGDPVGDPGLTGRHRSP